MHVLFVELSAFQRHRERYLTDELYRTLQEELVQHPGRGNLIRGSGGLRKIRARSTRSGGGKRGGTRVIYYWDFAAHVIYFFTIYDKSEVDDLTPNEIRLLRQLLDQSFGRTL